MAKVMNIGVLNVVDIKEEVASEISELKNIGLLIESDKSQLLLKKCKKINIGSTIKLPSEFKVDTILKNGFAEIDQDFLEGLSSPVVLLVNGKIVFHNNIDPKLLDEKLYKMALNGLLVCPNKLKGIIESRSVINGKSDYFKNEYSYIGENTKITNRFLKGLRADSQLAFSKLMIIEDIDLELFEKKIESIQVLDKLVMLDKYEDLLSYVEDSYKSNIIFLENGDKEVKYIDEDLIIDETSIVGYQKEFLYVEGDVEVYLDDSIKFSDYIGKLICDKLICDDRVYNSIRDNLGEDVKVQLIKGKLFKNSNKIELPNFIEEVTIRNSGKIIIKEDIDLDSFDKNVASIINYGVIEVDKSILKLVEGKISENYGKIRELKEEVEATNEDANEEILYSNMGELKL